MFSWLSHAHAQVDATAFGNVVNPIIANIVNPIVELMVGVGVLVFVWGIVEMIIHADDPDARSTGKRHMLGGIFGMFIILAAWAIVYLVANTVGGIK